MDTLFVAPAVGVLDVTSTITNVVATVAIAIFTFFVWRLQARQHQLAYEANVSVIEKIAQFSAATGVIRTEVVLNNTSLEPGIILEWKVRVIDQDFEESISDGRLVPTKILQIPRYIGGMWWAVERGRPVAFSMTRRIHPANPLTTGAKLEVQIGYGGGRGSPTFIKESIPIELV